MHGRILKAMLLMVGFFTILPASPFNGFAEMSVISGLDSYADQESLILRHENIIDRIKEYEIDINSLDERLLALKLDLEWLDLKFLDIQSTGRLIPQELIESRKRLRERQVSIAGEKGDLLKLIQAHTLTVENLDALIQQGKVKELSSIKPRDPGSGGNSIPGGKGSSIVEKDLVDDPVDVPDSGSENQRINELEQGLRTRINILKINDWVELINDNSGLHLEVQLPILFASGSSAINDSYDSFLKKIAALVKPHDAFIHVRGGTDGLKSKKISNIDLGAERAASIVNKLVINGVSPSIFKITSSGEYGQDLQAEKKSPSLKRRSEITVYFSD